MQPVQIDPCLSPAALAIQSIIRMVLDGSTYRTYDSQDDLDTLPCWILKSAYLAALEHIQLGDKSDINLWTKQLSGLKSSLTIFSRRWKLAGMNLISNWRIIVDKLLQHTFLKRSRRQKL